MNNKRDISIDAIRGFAVILVMFGHVLVWNNIEDLYVYNMIKAVQMPLFIAISGYISGFKPPIDDFKSFTNIIKRRATAYLLPFFSWLVLKHWDDLGWGLKNVLFNLDRGLWFLMTLFILTIMLLAAQLISGYIAKGNKTVRELFFWIIFILLALLIFIQNRLGNTFLSPNLTIYYMPFFMGGYIIKRYSQYLELFLKPVLINIGMVVSLILWIVLSLKYNFSSESDIITAIMQLIAGACGSLGIIVLFYKMQDNKIKKKLAYVGQYTLEIYVLHFNFATILNCGNIDFLWYTPKGLVFTISSFAVMTVITVVIIWVVKRYVPILDLLFFGRSKR